MQSALAHTSSARLEAIHRAVPARVQLRGENRTEGQPSWVTEAIEASVTRGDAEAIAQEMGCSTSLVYRYINPNNRAALPFHWAPAICRVTGRGHLIQAAAWEADYCAIKLPRVDASVEHEALTNLRKVSQEWTDVLAVTMTALEDRELTGAERGALKRELQELVTAAAAFEASLPSDEAK